MFGETEQAYGNDPYSQPICSVLSTVVRGTEQEKTQTLKNCYKKLHNSELVKLTK